MKSSLSQLSETEQKALSEDIERWKPWRSINYAVICGARRWMLTVCTLYIVLCTINVTLLGIYLFPVVLLADIFFTPRLAWDLRLSAADMLRVKTSPLPHGTTIVWRLTPFIIASLGLGASYSLFHLANLPEATVKRVGFIVLLSSFIWVSWFLPKHAIAADLFFCRARKNDSPSLPFVGRMKPLNPALYHPVAGVVLVLGSLCVVVVFLIYLIMNLITDTTGEFAEVFWLTIASALLLLVTLAMYPRILWWLKLSKIDHFLSKGQ